MNPLDHDANREIDLERLLDRLVDGELDAAARRALLARLDATPDGQGWRRCALAFLEAQVWREALRSAASPPVASAPAVVFPASAPPLARPWRPLALAATLLVAFALGWAVRGPGRPETLVAAAPLPVPAVAPVPASAPSASSSAPRPVGDEASVTDARDAVDPDAPASDASADDALARSLEAWQRRGYAVDRRDRTASVGLSDGRHVTLPVREFRLTYEGDRLY